MKILGPPARVPGFFIFQGSIKAYRPRELARRRGVWFLGTPRRLRRLPPRSGLRPDLVLHRGCAPSRLRRRCCTSPRLGQAPASSRIGAAPRPAFGREVLGSAYGLGNASSGASPSLVSHRGCAPTCLRQGGAPLASLRATPSEHRLDLGLRPRRPRPAGEGVARAPAMPRHRSRRHWGEAPCRREALGRSPVLTPLCERGHSPSYPCLSARGRRPSAPARHGRSPVPRGGTGAKPRADPALRARAKPEQ